jgi:hypothetical protein
MLALYTGILLEVRLGDVETATRLLKELDANTIDLPDNQRQLVALDAMARGGVAQLRGQTDVAEQQLRIAADAAVASGDQPVMAAVAIGIGAFALDRGDLDAAATALDLAVALRGVADPYDSIEQRIREAVELNSGTRPALGEGGNVPIDRESAAEALSQIFRR